MQDEPQVKSVPKDEIDPDEYLLYECLGLLKGPDEFYAFFKDLCTPQEIKLMKERWAVALQLGLTDKPYREVQKDTGASLGTITRVGRFLKNETYKGYQLVLSRIKRDLERNKK